LDCNRRHLTHYKTPTRPDGDNGKSRLGGKNVLDQYDIKFWQVCWWLDLQNSKRAPAIQELPCVRYTEQRAGIHLTFL
jgi:hypothetical protein